MRIRRVFVISLALISLCTGLITGQRIYYSVFLALFLISLFSVIFTYALIFTLRYSESISEGVIRKGNKAVLKIHLQSNLPLIAPRLELIYNTVDCSIKDVNQTKQIWLKPFGNTISNIEFFAEYSGFFTVGLVGITVYCPFGLYSIYTDMKRFKFHLPITILVLPEAKVPDNMSFISNMSEGSNSLMVRAAENSIQMDFPKSYTYGESLRNIHWKLSIRTKELFSKKYEESTHPNLILLLDCYDYGFRGLDGLKLKDALTESTASILNYALSENLTIRMIAYSKDTIRLQGDNSLQLESFIEILSHLILNGDTAIGDVIKVEQIEAKDSVILITNEVSSALFDELIWLKLRGIGLRVLCISIDDSSQRLKDTIRELNDQGVHAIHLTVDDDILQAVGEL